MNGTALDSAHETQRFSPSGWEYRGFRIHTKKVLLQPFYYAFVYSAKGDRAGFKVESFDSREKVVQQAKVEIDAMIAADGL